MTRGEVARLVAVMRAAWATRSPIGEDTVAVYCADLLDLDHGRALEAVEALRKTSEWFPTIAAIRARAVRDRVALPAPEEAWGIVRRAIGRIGMYRVPEFDCDEVHDAVAAIGWKSICTDDNEAATRARFCAAMASMIARRNDREATGRYRPAERMLPPAGEPASGDAHVLVETGYRTERPAAPALTPARETIGAFIAAVDDAGEAEAAISRVAAAFAPSSAPSASAVSTVRGRR